MCSVFENKNVHGRLDETEYWPVKVGKTAEEPSVKTQDLGNGGFYRGFKRKNALLLCVDRVLKVKSA